MVCKTCINTITHCHILNMSIYLFIGYFYILDNALTGLIYPSFTTIRVVKITLDVHFLCCIPYRSINWIYLGHCSDHVWPPAISPRIATIRVVEISNRSDRISQTTISLIFLQFSTFLNICPPQTSPLISNTTTKLSVKCTIPPELKIVRNWTEMRILSPEECWKIGSWSKSEAAACQVISQGRVLWS